MKLVLVGHDSPGGSEVARTVSVMVLHGVALVIRGIFLFGRPAVATVSLNHHLLAYSCSRDSPWGLQL